MLPVTSCETINIVDDAMVECDHSFTVWFDSVVDCEVDPPIVSDTSSTSVVIVDNDGMSIYCKGGFPQPLECMFI